MVSVLKPLCHQLIFVVLIEHIVEGNLGCGKQIIVVILTHDHALGDLICTINSFSANAIASDVFHHNLASGGFDFYNFCCDTVANVNLGSHTNAFFLNCGGTFLLFF